MSALRGGRTSQTSWNDCKRQPTLSLLCLQKEFSDRLLLSRAQTRCQSSNQPNGHERQWRSSIWLKESQCRLLVNHFAEAYEQIHGESLSERKGNSSQESVFKTYEELLFFRRRGADFGRHRAAPTGQRSAKRNLQRQKKSHTVKALVISNPQLRPHSGRLCRPPELQYPQLTP
jgi:hypothetical protein